MFLRPTSNLEQQLKKMYTPRTTDLIWMYRQHVPINENFSDNEVKIFE